MLQKVHVVILAAGQGTRMKSDLPKVLHTLGGKPLVERVIETAQALGAQRIHVVYGHGGERLRQGLSHLTVNWVEQAEQLGTGHAVEQAMPHIPDGQTVLILYGDVPLISLATLDRLLKNVTANGLALLTAELANPLGYGRIIRDAKGAVRCIVEEKDASDQQKQVHEINTGILAAPAKRLRGWLSRLENKNTQGEFYLTDVTALAVQDGCAITTTAPVFPEEIEGINNKAQLAQLERIYQQRQAEELMLQGVTLRDPTRFDLRGTLIHGRDVIIDVNVVMEGDNELGDGVIIGPNTYLRDVKIGDRCEVKAFSMIEQSELSVNCEVGPYARIRPETKLASGAKIGNFVEVKKSIIGEDSKVNHLSYIGDTVMGKMVNIGAGTITCNYDGAFKHQTIIGDGAFIGSDTQLVAPVEIGAGATIGAGSTITHDAPAASLTLSRSEQKTRKGWKRPRKN